MNDPIIYSYPLLGRGKVRDLYAIDNEKLLFVATDRLSAFDVVLPDRINGKGKILTLMSAFWMHKLDHVIPNHLLDIDPLSCVSNDRELNIIRNRSMVVKRMAPIPIEAVVRGYLAGSGWAEYQQTQSVCGVELPAGLVNAEQLPRPIFTPSSKAPVGEHDMNITFDEVVDMVGGYYAEAIRAASLQLYTEAARYAAKRGIIIADTKFEFGVDRNGALHLIDEVLTPDSSRFWDASQYAPGSNPPSFDKQFVRDYLAKSGWDKMPPAPHLDASTLASTIVRYRQAARMMGLAI